LIRTQIGADGRRKRYKCERIQEKEYRILNSFFCIHFFILKICVPKKIF